MDETPGGMGTLEEERPIEDSPSAPKRKASSSLLVSLLGQSFTDTEGTVELKTPYARAEGEMERYCKAPSLPLTKDPLNWWRVQEITFPLLSRLSKRYLCIPGTSVSAERVSFTAGDVLSSQNTWINWCSVFQNSQTLISEPCLRYLAHSGRTLCPMLLSENLFVDYSTTECFVFED